jgi:stage II sporulation protein P
MEATPCSLLLEFGTDANTLEEAVYSASLIGESIGKMLNKELKK